MLKQKKCIEIAYFLLLGAHMVWNKNVLYFLVSQKTWKFQNLLERISLKKEMCVCAQENIVDAAELMVCTM